MCNFPEDKNVSIFNSKDVYVNCEIFLASIQMNHNSLFYLELFSLIIKFENIKQWFCHVLIPDFNQKFIDT